MIEPWDVRAAIVARIEALTPSGYSQDNDDAWRESETPLIPEFMPEHLAHLAFWLDDRDGTTVPSRENSAEAIELRPRLTVRFLARLRPNSRNDDWVLAQRAQMALIRQLNNWQPAEFDILLDDAIYTSRVVGNDYLACELRLRAVYQTSAV